MKPGYLRPEEAAQYLSVSLSTIYNKKRPFVWAGAAHDPGMRV